MIDCQIDGWTSLGRCSELECRIEVLKEVRHSDSVLTHGLVIMLVSTFVVEVAAMSTKLC
jgi:hypothetical protein